MDCKKTGDLILSLRKESGLTQKQLGDMLCVSDKTVSKWERGTGFPDISIISHIAEIFEVNTKQILSGEIELNESDGGNMKRIKFYVCPSCNNILSSTSEAQIYCCGRELKPLQAKKADENHIPEIEVYEDDYFISFKHEMTKEHYIAFAAYVTLDRVLMIKMYPEQNPEIRFPKRFKGKLYVYCNQHGFFEYAGMK